MGNSYTHTHTHTHTLIASMSICVYAHSKVSRDTKDGDAADDDNGTPTDVGDDDDTR
jgi:hypothetical protein